METDRDDGVVEAVVGLVVDFISRIFQTEPPEEE